MNTEGSQLADVLARIGRSVLDQLQDLPDEPLNRAVPIREANTLFALATHLVGAGEFWVLVLAAGRQIGRDRDAEFRASGTYAELAKRYTAWIAAVQDALSDLGQGAFERLAEPPPEFRQSLGDQPLTVRACILHAVEHSALHLGQIQLTRSLLSEQWEELAEVGQR
jgi:uncharacterized damage-inducible protein DinB